MNLREYFEINADKLAAAVIGTVIVTSAIGFRKRSTGMAMFVSNMGSAGAALMLLPVLQHYGYDWEVAVPIDVLAAGAFTHAAFSVLMRIADRIEARGNELADKVIDKYLPGGKDRG